MIWALITGYLIGSFSPGHLLGYLFKGIDIRNFGNRNTGATNTYRTVGPVYGIMAGVVDFIKAPLSYYLAFSFFNLGFDLAILVGLIAVVGHIFPFYLNFRGGRGIASLFGLNTLVIFTNPSVFSLILLAGTVIFIIAISKRIVLERPLRKALKLIAIIFPLSLLWLPQEIILWTVGILLILSFILDLARLLSFKFRQRYLSFLLFAKKEEALISGTTFLLLSTFFVIWYFPVAIAILALVFFMLGDILAPIGQSFLPIGLIREKTLGGFLIFFFISLAAGLFIHSLTFLAIPFSTILIGAFSAAVLDQLSFIDDNLVIPVGTAFLINIFG